MSGGDVPLNLVPSQSRSKLEQGLGWALLLLLFAGCLIVVRPFVSALLWAVVLCFSSWPIYRRVLRLVSQRRTLASALMALGMVLILLVPLVIVGSTLADNVKDLTAAARRSFEQGPPPPPAWLAKVPALGNRRRPIGKALPTIAQTYGQMLGGSSSR